MRIAGCDNSRTNFTASFNLSGARKNITKDAEKMFSQKALNIGTPQDVVNVHVEQASQRNLDSIFDFSGIMARVKFSTKIGGEESSFTIKTPSENNYINAVLETLQNKFPAQGGK